MKTTIIAALFSLAFAAQAETVRQPPTGFPPKPIVVEIPAPPMQQQQGQGQQQHTSVRTGNTSLKSEANLSVTSVHQAQERDPVATAAGQGLTSSAASSINGTCFGSSGAGVQVPAVGVNFGSTYKDDGCDVRYDVQMLDARGEHEEAFERGCDKPEVRAARKRVGKRLCMEDQKTAAKADEPTDPYVRRRLGLPAL